MVSSGFFLSSAALRASGVRVIQQRLNWHWTGFSGKRGSEAHCSVFEARWKKTGAKETHGRPVLHADMPEWPYHPYSFTTINVGWEVNASSIILFQKTTDQKCVSGAFFSSFQQSFTKMLHVQCRCSLLKTDLISFFLSSLVCIQVWVTAPQIFSAKSPSIVPPTLAATCANAFIRLVMNYKKSQCTSYQDSLDQSKN